LLRIAAGVFVSYRERFGKMAWIRTDVIVPLAGGITRHGVSFELWNKGKAGHPLYRVYARKAGQSRASNQEICETNSRGRKSSATVVAGVKVVVLRVGINPPAAKVRIFRYVESNVSKKSSKGQNRKKIWRKAKS
jgi:hypothetical protein